MQTYYNTKKKCPTRFTNIQLLCLSFVMQRNEGWSAYPFSQKQREHPKLGTWSTLVKGADWRIRSTYEHNEASQTSINDMRYRSVELYRFKNRTDEEQVEGTNCTYWFEDHDVGLSDLNPKWMPAGFVGDTNGVNHALGHLGDDEEPRKAEKKEKREKQREPPAWTPSTLYLFLNFLPSSFKKSDRPHAAAKS